MWRKPTVDDLAAALSQREIDAFRQSGGLGGADPAEAIVSEAAALVRSYIRSSGSVALSPEEGQIPESLIPCAMDWAAFQILKRLPVPVGEDRRKAYDDALAAFRDIAAHKLAPEPWNAGESAPAEKVSIRVVTCSRSRVSPAKLEGL